MKQTKDLKELEGKIGYTFKDKTLFKQALTHSSYANEHRHEGLKDNERLEFLGDAVLEIISSEYLFYNYPDMAEGEMTKTYCPPYRCHSKRNPHKRLLFHPRYCFFNNSYVHH